MLVIRMINHSLSMHQGSIRKSTLGTSNDRLDNTKVILTNADNTNESEVDSTNEES